MVTEVLPGVRVHSVSRPGHERVLTAEALGWVASLVRAFGQRRSELLGARQVRAERIDAGELPDFLPETKHVRDGDWKVAPLPADLRDRRVEITGPVDRKMVINALNSGANLFMADFEDSSSPTWDNQIGGQANLMDAVRRELALEVNGKRYRLNDRVATLLVRPRGWHLEEAHLEIDGQPAPGSLVDFGLFFFHNARELVARGSGPYFYLPKLESHLEARLWNDVFLHAQRELGLPSGTIKATVLIETLPAAFEMDEILFELREHSAGLNCGRWDYIFSYIKKLRAHADRVLPDRSQVTMDRGFLRAYSLRLIATCHRRGVHAMGGMAAQIPIKNDPVANEAAMAKVRADKLREVTDGHDGTWVAHPGLVSLAREIFDAHMPGPNQIDRTRADVITAEDLLRPVDGTRTEQGLRRNVRVGIQYLEAWLGGSGCVPIDHLMEDAATAEIARAQVWQWRHHGITLESGQQVTTELLRKVIAEEARRVADEVGPERYEKGKFREATGLFEQLSVADAFEDFLTVPAYRQLVG